MPLDGQAAVREWSSPLEMSSNAAVVLVDFGLCCCWCCGEFRRWDVGKGQFIFYNPMDAVMALQRNMVMGKCWGQANRERKEMGLDWTGRGASWDAAQFSAVYLLTVRFVLSSCQDCWECVAASPHPPFHSFPQGNRFSLNSPPSNYSLCKPKCVISPELFTYEVEPFTASGNASKWQKTFQSAGLHSWIIWLKDGVLVTGWGDGAWLWQDSFGSHTSSSINDVCSVLERESRCLFPKRSCWRKAGHLGYF